jgi:hypothetical protein
MVSITRTIITHAFSVDEAFKIKCMCADEGLQNASTKHRASVVACMIEMIIRQMSAQTRQ